MVIRLRSVEGNPFTNGAPQWRSHEANGGVKQLDLIDRAGRRAGSPLARIVIYSAAFFGATLYAAMMAFALYATFADARCQNSGGKPMQFGFDIRCQR